MVFEHSAKGEVPTLHKIDPDPELHLDHTMPLLCNKYDLGSFRT